MKATTTKKNTTSKVSKMPKEKRLSKKEKIFAEVFIKTGNGTVAALEAYDTDKENIAANIAHQNLRKPKIQNVIQEALSDDLLAKKHNDLLNASTLSHTSFDKELDDEEIRDFVKDIPGAKLFRIVQKDDKKIAYIKMPDTNIQEKALDKAYKIKGTYAPEKKAILNINHELKQKARSDFEDYLGNI